jgi:hypothetical protein
LGIANASTTPIVAHQLTLIKGGADDVLPTSPDARPDHDVDTSVGLSITAYTHAILRNNEDTNDNYLHAMPSHYHVECWQGAPLTKVKPIQPRLTPLPKRVGGKRGAITRLSDDARRHMREALHKFPDAALSKALFVTLSYPADYPTPAESKVHFKRFKEWMRRAHPTSCTVWKLEYQERGAPHFHLLIMGVQTMPLTWLKHAWAKCVKSGDPLHLSQGAHIKRVTNPQAVRSYLSKWKQLPAKILGGHTGRFWGVFGHRELYEGEHTVTVITGPQAAQIRRISDKSKLSRARMHTDPRKLRRAIRNARKRRSNPYSFTCLVTGERLLGCIGESGNPKAIGRRRRVGGWGVVA